MKVAMRKVIRDSTGSPKVVLVDVNTNQIVSDPTGYTISSAGGFSNEPLSNTESTKQESKASEQKQEDVMPESRGESYFTGRQSDQKAKTISTSLFGVDYYPNQPSKPTTSKTRMEVQRAALPSTIEENSTVQTPAQKAIDTQIKEDLPPREMAELKTNLSGARRSEMPSSGIENKVQDVVTDLYGPGYTVELFSGQEPKGMAAVGSNRHPAGYAGDFRVYDNEGELLTVKDNPEVFRDISQMMAARYGANVGFGEEYMGGIGIHLDTMPADKFGKGQGAQWASGAKGMGALLDESRETGLLPSSYFDKMTSNPPTPQARPVDIPVTETPQLGVNRNFTDEEKNLMAMTLAGEIDPRYTDLTTKDGRIEAMGILSTMENRAPRYGSIENAIIADNQYSTWNNQKAADIANQNYAKNPDLYNSLVNEYISDPSLNLGFTSYYNPKISNPAWGSKMKDTIDLGPHRFGKLDEYLTNLNSAEKTEEPKNSLVDYTGGMSQQRSQELSKSVNDTAKDSWSSSVGSEMAFSAPDTSSWSGERSTESTSQSRDVRDSINREASSGWASNAAESITGYSSDGWSSSSINSTAKDSWSSSVGSEMAFSGPSFSDDEDEDNDYSASNSNTNSFGGPR